MSRVVAYSEYHVMATARVAKKNPGRRPGVQPADDARGAAAERLARGGAPAKPKAPARPAAKDTDTQALESDLSDVLGLDVEVIDRGGAGELRIKYATLEQLDDLCRRLTARAV